MNTANAIPIEEYDAKPRPRSLKLLSYSEMANMPEPEWLIDSLIQKRSTALMFGKSNSFKSFAAIDMALSVEIGMDWHGHAVSRGRVLLVVTEGANGVGRLRIPAWYDHHGIDGDKRGAFLYPQELCLDAADDVSALIASIIEKGPFALVVLDIFGGTMKGSEIEDQTARRWVHGVQRILRETGASVLVVAHAPYQDDSRIRGHSHFWGSFDSRLRMEGDKDKLTAILTVERHKDADSSGSWGFRLERAGGSLVPVLDIDVTGSKRSFTGREREMMDALDAALIDHGHRNAGTDWPLCPVVLVSKWRDAFYRASGEDGAEAKRKAFARGLKTLRHKQAVGILDDHAWRCQL